MTEMENKIIVYFEKPSETILNYMVSIIIPDLPNVYMRLFSKLITSLIIISKTNKKSEKNFQIQKYI